MTELVDELSEGVVGVAEPPGGILLRQTLDEDGPEGFVLLLQDSLGSEKEVGFPGCRHGIACTDSHGVIR